MGDQCRISDVQGNESDHKVHQATNDRAAHGGFFILGTGHALKDVLLRDGAKGKCKESTGHGPPGGSIHVGREHVELPVCGRLRHHLLKAACIAAHQGGHQDQAHHNDHGLEQIGEGH